MTVGRADWNLWRPVLRQIQCRGLRFELYATGTHFSPEFGQTIGDVLADGWAVTERVEILLSSDSPQGMAKGTGLGILGFAQLFERSKPDLLLVLGDRLETLAVVVAALPFKLPVAHIHGGEISEGAIDDSVRHAITKMSHLHFAATELYAARIRQMGEEPWRVFVTGSPAIDNLMQTPPSPAEDLAAAHGLNPYRPFLLVTYHPATLEYEDTTRQVANLLAALEQVGLPLLLTYPNSDPSGRQILHMFEEFSRRHPNVSIASSLGGHYVTAMRHAAAMVGNSSSGIIEAASFQLPVVNVGTRQAGRLRPRNVIDVGYEANEIVEAVRRALRPEFRESLRGLTNLYGGGLAARAIVSILEGMTIDDRLLRKRFVS